MRRQAVPACLCLTLLWAALPSPATAQARQGFWAGAGGGLGLSDVTCDDCAGDREVGGSGYVKLGWTLNDQVLFGAEFNFWEKFALEESLEATVSLYNLSGTVTYYPSASRGFFIKGGAGTSAAEVDFDLAGTAVTAEIGTGFGLLAGAGYDLRVPGRGISVTPAVNYWYGRLGDVTLRGQPSLDNWKHDVIDFTIGITFH